jgi:hypothetical protein
LVSLDKEASKRFPNIRILLQFCWRRGAKDSRGQGFKGLFSKGFISTFNILSISVIFLMKSDFNAKFYLTGQLLEKNRNNGTSNL